MTTEQYFEQYHRAMRRIDSLQKQLNNLWQQAESVSSPNYGDRIQTSQNTNATFVNALFKIDEMRKKIDKKVALAADLVEEMADVIDGLSDAHQREVLYYVYIDNKQPKAESIAALAAKRGRSVKSVERWYREAIKNAVLPPNPITI